MLPIARRHSHYVFAVLQSGLTTFVATGIASFASARENLLTAWIWSWATAWALMLPLVIVAAPGLRRMAVLLTRAESDGEVAKTAASPRPNAAEPP